MVLSNILFNLYVKFGGFQNSQQAEYVRRNSERLIHTITCILTIKKKEIKFEENSYNHHIVLRRRTGVSIKTGTEACQASKKSKNL